MSRIGYIADVHAANHGAFGGPKRSGINTRCRLIVDALARAMREAAAQQCTDVVVAGDLFDTVRPEPQIVAAVGEALYASPAVNVHALVGNHDHASSDPGDHALAALRWVPNVLLVERPTIRHVGRDASLWLVPYAPGNTFDWLPGVLDGMAREAFSGSGTRNVALALHAGISTDTTAPWMRGSHDSIGVDALHELCIKHHITAAFAGNWHSHKSWRMPPVDIVQIGALTPTGFDNPGVDGYGSLIVHDTAKGTWELHEIPGPRFIPVAGDFAMEIYRDEAQYAEPGALFVSWRVPAAQLGAATTLLAADVIELKLGGGEVKPDKAQAKDTRAQIAQRAGATRTLDEALATFVEQMELPDGVDRARVLERCVSFFMRDATTAMREAG
jgi:hypothetical protein